ncbi:MAG TPA: hypothetical protein VFY18_13225, partial [Candidatus Limnocylindrales bacterium]|nr:hypothetical protein [Candidatus Limnocylindrales bacterium]
MTSPRRFEQDLPALLAGGYFAGSPDYRDDLFRETARMRQRPAWSFLTRWIPMDVATRRLPFPPLPWRAIGVLALLLLVAAALLVVVGSRPHVPAPFGLARNGAIAYTSGGDIFVRDTVDSPERMLMGANGKVNSFWGWSPDGTRFLFFRSGGGLEYLFAADADGSHERQILDVPITNSQSAWAPDGRTVSVTLEDDHDMRQLYLAHVDGSPATRIDLGSLQPTDTAWRPPNGAELLIRGLATDGKQDLYLMNADGTNRRALHLPSPGAFGGPEYDLSGATWSPSGDRIAYNAVEPIAGDPPGHFRIHIVNADGSGDVGPPGPPDDATQEGWPIWSPDGRSIAVAHFSFTKDGSGRLAILSADGSAAAREVGPKTHDTEDMEVVKTWSPDGT